MIFAKIDFINLLPFHIYIKKNIKSNQLKSIIDYKKSYPSLINQKFKKRLVDSAFISSIASKNEDFLDFGIVAQYDVLSVLLIPGLQLDDYQSQTSNLLAKVLNLEGKVIIGDKALKFYHENPNIEKIDLAKEWKEKYNLPFVFAVLCYNKNKKHLQKLKMDRFICMKQRWMSEWLAFKLHLSKTINAHYLENTHVKSV